jgi:copper chaperone
MKQTALKIEGMSCGHCTRAVTQALQGLDGVEIEQVEIGSAALRYDPARLDPEQITRAIEEEGYTVREQTSTP